jgi:hypothetical protein
MKKIFLFSVLLLAFVSCSEDVKFNNPSFEGKKDGVFWRAVDYKATITNSGLVIQAFSSKEVVTLKTISATPQTYPLGTSSNIASYVFTSANVTTTYTSEDKKVSEGSEIVIEEYDAVNKTVSGTFKFNVKNLDASSLEVPTVNFQYGRFYKIPVVVSDYNIVTSPAIP